MDYATYIVGWGDDGLTDTLTISEVTFRGLRSIETLDSAYLNFYNLSGWCAGNLMCSCVLSLNFETSHYGINNQKWE